MVEVKAIELNKNCEGCQASERALTMIENNFNQLKRDYIDLKMLLIKHDLWREVISLARADKLDGN